MCINFGDMTLTMITIITLSLAYRILQIVHGRKLSWMQNKIQFDGKNSRLTVRSI